MKKLTGVIVALICVMLIFVPSVNNQTMTNASNNINEYDGFTNVKCRGYSNTLSMLRSFK